MVLIALMVRESGGKILALLLSCLSFLLSIAYLRTFHLFQPVFLDQLCWIAIFWISLKFINSKNPVWVTWLGVALGFGFLSKYSALFFGFAIIAALLRTSLRKMLFTKYEWIGVFVFIIIISPNLYWQFQHNWPVVKHMAKLQQTQLINVTLSFFL